MSRFIIIENDDGLLVVGLNPDENPEQAALARGGVVVDEGPYDTYDAAYDAMLLIPDPVDDLHGET